MIPLARYAKFLPDTSVQSPKCFTTAKKKSSRCTVFLSYNVCSSAAAYGFARIFIRTRLEGFPSSYRSDAEIYIKIIPSFHRLMSLILIHHHIIKICICSFNYPKHKPRHFSINQGTSFIAVWLATNARLECVCMLAKMAYNNLQMSACSLIFLRFLYWILSTYDLKKHGKKLAWNNMGKHIIT